MKHRLGPFGIIILIVLLLVFVPWNKVNWGKVRWLQAETVTVTGEAKLTQKNQIASFNAGVSLTGKIKEDVVNEVNEKMDALIKQIKEFGIEEKDIETGGISVYESIKRDSNEKEWRVSNSVMITLREVDRASDLATLLAGSEANSVSGPSFSYEDNNQSDEELIQMAMDNAIEKAEILAGAAGRKLGKVINVSEGNSGVSYPIMAAAKFESVDSAVPVEPGSSTINKSLNVVFELE